MYAIRLLSPIVVVSLSVVLGSPAHAGWVTQDITLRPGWNAVHFEVQPADNTCDAVFAGTPVRSVWAWNKRFSSVQYVRNPSELLPEQPEWLTYFPPESRQGFLTDLYAVHGGQAYLIEVGGSETIHLTVVGRPTFRKKKWMAHSFNLVGFSVDPDAPPTAAQFFAPDDALSGQPIYRLNESGQWKLVRSPSTEVLRSGEAYWVYCKGESVYSGPLSIDLGAPGMLAFGHTLNELVLGLKNESASERTVTLELLPADPGYVKSKDAPAAPLAGDVALSYRRLLSWAPLSEPMTIPIEPNSELGVRLAVRRADMTPVDAPEAQYGSVLQVRDGAGALYRIGVTAERDNSRAGLWVGTAVVNMVSETGNPDDLTTPTATGSDFRFRLIVHMDADGNANLLQQCVLMQVADDAEEGENDGQDADGQPSRFVLLTDDSLIPEYEGVSLRDGETVGRRISSPAFSFAEPVPMEGTFETRLVLAEPIVLDYDDPLNPFVHRYHPDHDNMDDRYEILLDEGKESFTVTRMITLDFLEDDPEGFELPDWGYDLIGGDYYETVSGVHQKDIHVKGHFRLNRVVDVALLNDGR